MRQKYSGVRQRKFLLEVGGLCAFFRKEILKMTLRELSGIDKILERSYYND